jgi:hypothetical protein
MAGNALTEQSQLMCPHGGTVSLTGTAMAKAAGGTVMTLSGSATIAGCPFQIPAVVPIPSPCITVLWTVSDLRTLAGAPTLSQGSVGLCLAATGLVQGPVLVSNTQFKVSSQ